MMELVVTPSLCSDWLVPEWIDRKMIEPRPWNPLLHSYVAARGVGLGGSGFIHVVICVAKCVHLGYINSTWLRPQSPSCGTSSPSHFPLNQWLQAFGDQAEGGGIGQAFGLG